MKICVDMTSLADNFSGIERFAASIVKELIQDKTHFWILLFKNSVPKDFNLDGDNVKTIVIKGKNKLIFNQFILPLKLLNINADRFLFPAFPAPFFFFKKNVFNTIHDLSCWDCPGSNKLYMIYYFKLMYWKASLNNKKIVTVSEFSKERICSILHVCPDNVTVIYNGISDQFNNIPPSEIEKEHIQKKYSLPSKFVLCLSTLEPRKNLRLLLNAYSILFKQGVKVEIVLAGRKGWKMDDFLNGYSRSFLEHIHFTGFIDEEDLAIIYKMADIFIFPSLYEGFGIPPLEALACGTTVISSNASAMPEVLGDMAVYFESGNVEDLVDKITNISSLQKKNDSLTLNTNIYNWSKQARYLLDSMVKNR